MVVADLQFTSGVNPSAVFVNYAHQNRSLPKLTCYLSHSAWISFTLADTEKQRQLLETSLCVVLFIQTAMLIKLIDLLP